MSKRASARGASIDEYVISESDRLYKNFLRYQALLLDEYDNVYLTRYEDMISDFEAWLTDLLSYCELDVSRNLFDRLIKESRAKKPEQEDITKHIRKGVPGDYKEKLKPASIETLNNKLEPLLVRFHYQRAAAEG